MPDTLTDKAVAAQAAPNTTPAPASEAPLHPADSPPLTPNEPVDEMEDTLLAPDLAPVDPIDGLVEIPGEEDLDADLDAAAELDAVVVEDDEEEDDDEALPKTSNRVAPRMPGHMPGVPNRPVMHARLPSKAEVFVEGDHVVYPTHGVGKVERIATEEIAGHKL